MVFICIVIVYSYSKSKNLIHGPEITIYTPENGFVSTSSPIVIRGKALNINAIYLNDRAIYIDEEGNFLETVILSPGYNKIELSAKDKFGGTTTRILELIHKPSLEH